MQLAAGCAAPAVSAQRARCIHRHVAHAIALLKTPAARHVASRHRAQLTSSRRAHVVHSFEGDATKALKEAAALDELIDMLMSAKSEQEMARIVAENIFSFNPKFWLRIATRADSAAAPSDRERLGDMANRVMVLVDAMVKSTEEKLTGSARVLQDILAAAADENGEWYVPLTAEQVQRVRDALDARADQLDEALLSNAFAWIRKCSEDRFDTMVTLIQKVLQLYAARELRGPEKQGVEGYLNEVLYAEEGAWGALIRDGAASGSFSEVDFMEALQRKMEATVLGMSSGSYAQRVQAEYLKEVEARARHVFQGLAAAGASSGGSADASSD